MSTHTRQQRLWVVFTDQTDLWWLRFLRQGYRHCFMVIHDGRSWVTVDPLSHRMEIAVQDIAPEFDLPRWLKDQGHCVLRVRRREGISKPAPLMLFSCVETVKRVLGVRDRCVITPYQLYRHLLRPDTARTHYRKGVLSWEV